MNKLNNTSTKCNKCGVPLTGWGYNLIAKPLFRIKPGKKIGICNKCEGKH